MNTKVSLTDVPLKRRNAILRFHADEQRRTGQTLKLVITEQGKKKFMAEAIRPDGTIAGVC